MVDVHYEQFINYKSKTLLENFLSFTNAMHAKVLKTYNRLNLSPVRCGGSNHDYRDIIGK